MTILLIFGGVLLIAGLWGFLYFRGHPYDVSADSEQQKALDAHAIVTQLDDITTSIEQSDIDKARKAKGDKL